MGDLGKSVFVGEFRHNLDGKNRMTVPSKWRFEGDQDDVYVAIPDKNSGCIMVYPPAMVERLQELTAQVGMSDPVRRKVLTRMFSQAEQFGCDKNGRITLPERLCQHAGIEREVVLAGNFNAFQIWNPDRYKSYLEQEDEDEPDAFRELGL